MSTSCLIGVLDNSGDYQNWTVKYVYCHSDGYPSHIGKVLRRNYNSYELASALVSLPSFTFLEPTIEDMKRSGRFYANTKANMTMSYQEYRETTNYGADYAYLFTPGRDNIIGWWSVRRTYGYDLDMMEENNSYENY